MTLLLAEELALLAYDDRSGKPASDVYLPYGLGGALLAELALLGRVTLDDKRVAVADPSGTGDALLDDALRRIADRPGQRPQRYVNQLRKGVQRAVLDRLVAAGYLRKEAGRMLFVLPTTVYPEADPAPERAIRQRLHDVVVRGVEPDERSVALAVLVHACELDKKVFPDVARKRLRTTLNELTEGEWAGMATRKAIQAVRSAMLAATSSAASAGTS